MSTAHQCQAREFPPEWQFREEQRIISAFATVNTPAYAASDVPDTESILQGEAVTEVLQNVTTMRDILPSPVRRIVLEEYGFTPQAPVALGAPPEPDSATTATAPAPVMVAPVRHIVAPLSFEPCHDDITGIIDALAAMPPPSAVVRWRMWINQTQCPHQYLQSY